MDKNVTSGTKLLHLLLIPKKFILGLIDNDKFHGAIVIAPNYSIRAGITR